MKKKWIWALCSMFVALLCVFMPIKISKGETQTASAVTTAKYLAIGNLKITNNNTSNTYIYSKDAYYDYFTVHIYGGTGVGEQDASNGKRFSFKSLTIEVNLKEIYFPQRPSMEIEHEHIKLEGAWNTYVDSSLNGTGKITFNVGSVYDGEYTLTYKFGGSSGFISIDYVFTYTFTINQSADKEAPQIQGASLEETGLSTNTAFSVSAYDTGSGLKAFYMKKPSESAYSEIGTEITIPDGSENGLYCFYAVDALGNTSQTHYVCYDTVAPVNTFYNSSGGVITNKYYNNTFYYLPADGLSGIDYMEYKKPQSNEWVRYGGERIESSADNGTYTFRAWDKAGNCGVSATLVLDTEKPTGTVYGDAIMVANGGVVKADCVRFVASDTLSGINKTYVKTPSGTTSIYAEENRYTEAGKYSFYCTDNAGNISMTYTLTLDLSAPSLSCTTNFFAISEKTFTVSAVDDFGTAKLYYKTPSDTTYVYTGKDSVEIKAKDENGTYYFYAVDSVGNQSEIVWVKLEVLAPTYKIVRDEDKNRLYLTWDFHGGSATLNGNAYEKNTWIEKESAYSFVLTDTETGKQAFYDFTITHYYITIDGVKPTCTKSGYLIEECVTCGEQKNTENIPALGHNYTDEIVHATCTTQGYRLHTCQNCGDFYATDYVLAYGHAYELATLDPTCVSSGGEKHLCSVCGYNYLTDEKPALGHNYHSEVTVVATCNMDGERKHYCERCHDEYITVIPSFGHEYTIVGEETKDGITTRTYGCIKCEETYEQDLGNEYEKISSYVEFLFEKYSRYMVWVFLATSGVWSAGMGIAVIVANKNEEKEKAKRMVKNYCIGLIVIFTILVACPFLVRGIAALIA